VIREPTTYPLYPVTYQWPGKGNTGNVWAWIFWWVRNGMAYVAAAPNSDERAWREQRRHSVLEEIKTEAYLLPW
jgi:hypothetical protein